MVKNLLRATYSLDSYFKIPDEIDLNAEGIEWGIKWEVLYINTADGKKYKIEPCSSPEESHDFKRPNETEIVENDAMFEDCEEEGEEENIYLSTKCKKCDKWIEISSIAEESKCVECM